MKKLLSLILALCLVLSLSACGAPASSTASSGASASVAESAPAQTALPTVDRSGAAITIPETVNSIIVMAPSITETVIALGCGDKIIANDTQSIGIEGLKEGLPAFDIMSPDAEQLAALNPDVIFVSGLSMSDGSDPFQTLIDLGICVVCIPTSSSIEGIKEDIAFTAAVLGKTAEGEAINSDLQAQIDEIAAIGSKVTEKKTVYFEIAAAPYAYSFGSGVYLNEMIELIGAENVFAAQDGWMSVETEAAVAANPDVILTNVNYIENPVEEILGREGWGEVNAVKNGEVYYIDNMSSSLANQNIVLALTQMAKAVYPDLYA